MINGLAPKLVEDTEERNVNNDSVLSAIRNNTVL
jgi:hypothetical protein